MFQDSMIQDFMVVCGWKEFVFPKLHRHAAKALLDMEIISRCRCHLSHHNFLPVTVRQKIDKLRQDTVQLRRSMIENIKQVNAQKVLGIISIFFVKI